MIAAGLVEVWLGVSAEQKPLEEIATPLTAEDAAQPTAEDGGQPTAIPAAAGAAVATGTAQRRRLWSPMPPVYAAPLIDTARDREVEEIAAALAGAGALERRRLAQLVHADLWGPGRFSPALREAVVQGRVRRTGRGLYALVPGAPDPGNDLTADDARHGDGTGHQR
jgi:hypothetical protein